ncbi:bifunctional glutamate N-acetyltransferase/amino-acid acetyltransferase ArgJ [Magnetovibrio blakemorei]|uniref:Arginine biosynthesis bifunctional protein ArgJ n=1 Tax=Magnetovibrio blakemorei TaxID=28181 RepID=A0A1E5Q4I5_9PROT|nr:bifunctional glutamate N-acetyltransferase/amino-acid acetyltransferase ArgJ [Magnetovibrio blakemorei]OEJ65086.1 bifunctional ornithine acetyltransferase/N-acetylglutamate synthase [Magnetovibrio blakemorei]
MDLQKSPLAPASFPPMADISGVRFATVAAGIKYKGRTDLMLAEFVPGTTVAGVFTNSKTASAPVLKCREYLPGGQARALVVNSGNSNAFTGRRGEESVDHILKAVADAVGCAESEVFSASTGVIGEPLPHNLIVDAMPGLQGALGGTTWQQAAEAIMTTDTYPKGVSRTTKIGDTEVHINGFVKGSGMIAPDMATMLGYIFTDAAIGADVLQALLAPASDASFNCITVDSDTSTSDTVMMFATAQAGNAAPQGVNDPALNDFKRALDEVTLDLAHQVVRDGEGATKFVAITVTGAENDLAAKRIGLSIANSPLVKTAIAGEDANWGRIVMAVGKAGEAADRDKMGILIGGVQVTQDGMRVEGYDEAPVVKHMQGQEIEIEVEVGIANGRATVWTCDLTHGYISINGDYRS